MSNSQLFTLRKEVYLAVSSSPSRRQVCAPACVSHHDELLSATNESTGIQKASSEDRQGKKRIFHLRWYVTIPHTHCATSGMWYLSSMTMSWLLDINLSPDIWQKHQRRLDKKLRTDCYKPWIITDDLTCHSFCFHPLLTPTNFLRLQPYTSKSLFGLPQDPSIIHCPSTLALSPKHPTCVVPLTSPSWLNQNWTNCRTR